MKRKKGFKKFTALFLALSLVTANQSGFSSAYANENGIELNEEIESVEVVEVEDTESIVSDTTSSGAIVVDGGGFIGDSRAVTSELFYGAFSDDIAGQERNQWLDVDYKNKTLTRMLSINYTVEQTPYSKYIKLKVPVGLRITGEPNIGTSIGEVKGISKETLPSGVVVHTYDLGGDAAVLTGFNVIFAVDSPKIYDGLVTDIVAELYVENTDIAQNIFTINSNIKNYNVSYDANGVETTLANDANNVVVTNSIKTNGVNKPVEITLGHVSYGARLALEQSTGSSRGGGYHDYEFKLDLKKLKVDGNTITQEQLAGVRVDTLTDVLDAYYPNRIYSVAYDADNIVTVSSPLAHWGSKHKFNIVFSSDVFANGSVIDFGETALEASSYINKETWGGRDGDQANKITNYRVFAMSKITLNEIAKDKLNAINLYGTSGYRTIISNDTIRKLYPEKTDVKQELFLLTDINNSNYDFEDLTINMTVPEGVTITDIFVPLESAPAGLELSVNGQTLLQGEYTELNMPVTGSFDVVIKYLGSSEGIIYSLNSKRSIRFAGTVSDTYKNGDTFSVTANVTSVTYTDDEGVKLENATDLIVSSATRELSVIDKISASFNNLIEYRSVDNIPIESVDFNVNKIYLRSANVAYSYPYLGPGYKADNFVIYLSVPNGLLFSGNVSDVLVDNVSGRVETIRLINDSKTADGRGGKLYEIVLDKELYISADFNGFYGNSTGYRDVRIAIKPDDSIEGEVNVKLLRTDVLWATKNPLITGLGTAGTQYQLSTLPGFMDSDKELVAGVKDFAAPGTTDSSFNVTVPKGIMMKSESSNGDEYNTWDPADTTFKDLNDLYLGANNSLKSTMINSSNSAHTNFIGYFVLPVGEEFGIELATDEAVEEWVTKATSSDVVMYYTTTPVNGTPEWNSDDTDGGTRTWTLATGTLPEDITAIKYVFAKLDQLSRYSHTIPFRITAATDINNLTQEEIERLYGPATGITMFKTDTVELINSPTTGFRLVKSAPPTILSNYEDELTFEVNTDVTSFNADGTSPWTNLEVDDDYTGLKDVSLDTTNSTVVFQPLDGGTATTWSLNDFTGISTLVEGTYTFTYVSTSDTDGQVTRKTTTIVVEKQYNDPATITLENAELTYEADKNGVLEVAAFVAAVGFSAVDTYGVDLTNIITHNFTKLALGTIGEYIYTIAVVDGGNNRTTAEVKVIIEDTTKPVVEIDSNEYVIPNKTSKPEDFNTILETLSFTYSDNSNGTVSVEYDESLYENIDTTVAGTTTITVEVTDSSDNVSSMDIDIRVTAAPTITVGETSITLEVDPTKTSIDSTLVQEIFAKVDPIAKDENGEILTIEPDWNNLDITELGEYEVYLTAEDAHEVNVSRTIKVTVVDTTKPVFESNKITLAVALHSELTLDELISQLGITVTDNYDTSLEIESTDFANVDLSVEDTYTVILTSTDSSGNTGSITVTVTTKNGLTVTNTEFDVPVVNKNTDVFEANSAPTFEEILNMAGAVAVSTDSTTRRLVVNDIVTDEATFNALDFATIGTNTLDIFVEFENGSTSSETLTINVVDTVKPIVTANDSIYLTYGKVLTNDELRELMAITAVDNYDDEVDVTISHSINFTVAGEQYITMYATDANGNVTDEVTISAMVSAAPTIELTNVDAENKIDVFVLNKNNDIFEANTVPTFAEFLYTIGATALNSQGQVLEVKIFDTDAMADETDQEIFARLVDFNTLGETVIEIYGVDEYAQTEKIAVTINVVDQVSPIINSLESINVPFGTELSTSELIELISAVVIDNYDDTVELVIENNIDFNKSGEYTITLNATDSSGNVAKEVKVAVTINSEPVLNIPNLDANSKIQVNVINKNLGENLFQENFAPTYAEFLELIGAKATNNAGEELVIKIFNQDANMGETDEEIFANLVDFTVLGETALMLYGVDVNAETEPVVVIVNVVDEVAPIITSDVEKLSFSVGDSKTFDEIVKAFNINIVDNYNDGLILEQDNFASVNFSQAGTYTVDLLATDKSGNIGTKSITIVVVAVGTPFEPEDGDDDDDDEDPTTGTGGGGDPTTETGSVTTLPENINASVQDDGLIYIFDEEGVPLGTLTQDEYISGDFSNMIPFGTADLVDANKANPKTDNMSKYPMYVALISLIGLVGILIQRSKNKKMI